MVPSLIKGTAQLIVTRDDGISSKVVISGNLENSPDTEFELKAHLHAGIRLTLNLLIPFPTPLHLRPLPLT